MISKELEEVKKAITTDIKSYGGINQIGTYKNLLYSLSRNPDMVMSIPEDTAKRIVDTADAIFEELLK
jgi:hypothetical protein